MWVGLNLLEAIVFGLFICIMMFDQLSAILDNSTNIGQLKGERGRPIATRRALEKVFGDGPMLLWLWPSAPGLDDKRYLASLYRDG